MKKFLCISSALIIAISCVAAGCAKPTLTKLTLNEVTHSVFYAPQYAAMALGYYEQEGIELDLVNGGGSDKSMAAVLSGDADIGLMGPETAVYVFNEGKEDHPIIIGQLTKCDGSFLVSREKDDNFNWSKLEGKTIIGGRKGGMPEMSLEYALKKNNLVPGENVNVDTSVQFNLMAVAFEGSNAEYVTLFEPTASMCEAAGKGYIVAAVGQESGNSPFTAYMIKKSTLEKNQALYQSFMNATAKGQKWVNKTDAKKVAEVIAPQFPDSDVPLLTKVVENYKKIGAWKDTPVMEEGDFDTMQNMIIEAGIMDTKAPFDKVVNNALAIKAK